MIKKYSFKIGILLSTILMMGVVSCKKSDGNLDTNKGGVTNDQKCTLTINLAHVFGDKPIEYTTVKYVTAANDTIRINKLAYYFTNIKLVTDDGTIVAPETYYLVDLDNPATTSITLTNLPKGNYKTFSFLIGVDSLHNHSGAQEGALDPGYNMLWTWNTGYIFYRFQGRIGAANAALSWDLGGDENLMKYNLSTNIPLDANRTMVLTMDTKELFQNPNVYDLKVDAKDIHSTTSSSIPKLVQNAKDMFSITSIQ